MKTEAIPTFLLTGSLGSGKTTLLNHILSHLEEQKFGVVVNEFGRIDVDGKLVETSVSPQLNLANGCIFCTIRKDMEESVLRLLRENPGLQGLIIEASGLADPQPIANTFLLSEALRPLVRMDSVIAVVDIEAFPRLRGKNAYLARRQVASSDLALLNKTDLATNEQIEKVESSLRNWVPGLRLVRCREGNVPLKLLLGKARFSEDQLAKGTPLEVHTHQPGDVCHHHTEEQFVIDSWTFEALGRFRARALASILKSLPERVYRAKGLVLLQGEGEEFFEVQLCGTRLDIRAANARRAGGASENRIVFLAEPGSLNVEQVSTQLREALEVKEELTSSEILMEKIKRLLSKERDLI